MTHVLRWVDGCPRWITEWLTPEQWGALRHIGHVAVIGGCVTAGALPPMVPTPVGDVNPHSPRAWLPVQGPAVGGYGPTPLAGLVPVLPRRHTVATPEPAGLAVVVVGLIAIAIVRRKRFQ